jgi:hypothetical protein
MAIRGAARTCRSSSSVASAAQSVRLASSPRTYRRRTRNPSRHRARVRRPGSFRLPPRSRFDTEGGEQLRERTRRVRTQPFAFEDEQHGVQVIEPVEVRRDERLEEQPAPTFEPATLTAAETRCQAGDSFDVVGDRHRRSVAASAIVMALFSVFGIAVRSRSRLRRHEHDWIARPRERRGSRQRSGFGMPPPVAPSSAHVSAGPSATRSRREDAVTQARRRRGAKAHRLGRGVALRRMRSRDP